MTRRGIPRLPYGSRDWKGYSEDTFGCDALVVVETALALQVQYSPSMRRPSCQGRRGEAAEKGGRDGGACPGREGRMAGCETMDHPRRGGRDLQGFAGRRFAARGGGFLPIHGMRRLRFRGS